jgi:hypothetical protein
VRVCVRVCVRACAHAWFGVCCGNHLQTRLCLTIKNAIPNWSQQNTHPSNNLPPCNSYNALFWEANSCCTACVYLPTSFQHFSHIYNLQCSFTLARVLLHVQGRVWAARGQRPCVCPSRAALSMQEQDTGRAKQAVTRKRNCKGQQSTSWFLTR